MAQFEVMHVQPEEIVGDEALGSKPKFWFRRGTHEWLFKDAREGTGEDWAEKVAAEIAHLVDIPAAIVELADYQHRRGCASRRFLSPQQGVGLVHGNEILAGMVLGYDRQKKFHQSQHTLDNIKTAVEKLLRNKESSDLALRALAAYVVLDALIGNTDRHHENWAFLARIAKTQDRPALELTVAPSFDHASSLGRELRDERRANIVRSAAVGNYVRKGVGGIYFGTSDKVGANPLRMAEFGARRFPEYFLPALQRLKATPLIDLQAVVDRVPAERMSEQAKAFSKAFVAYTYQALTALVK